MEDQDQADVIYTDFSTFDRPDLVILLHKLHVVGLSEKLLSLIRSYLSNRTQYVAMNGFKSVEYKATSEVPQESVLGPLFFII